MMWANLISTSLGRWIIGIAIAASIAAITASYWMTYQAGKTACENANIKNTIQNVEKRNETTQRIDRMPADDRRKQLLKWSVE